MGVSVNAIANGISQVGEFTNPGQILSGSNTATNSTTPVTLITIPAGRTWIGALTIGATNSAAAGTTATAKITTSSASTIPSNSVNLLTVHCSTVGTTAGLASQNNATPGDVIINNPTGSSITVQLTNSTATTFTSDATAIGILL